MENIQKKITVTSFLLVVIIAFIAFIGWIFKNLNLAGMSNDFIPMAPATILCFILLSLAALNMKLNKVPVTFERILISISTILIGIIAFDYFSGYSLNIEHSLIKTTIKSQSVPVGLMSPATAILFLLCIGSLYMISYSKNRLRLAIIISLIGLYSSFLFDLGYLYQTPLLYERNIVPPAWNTSLAFTILFLGILVGFGMNHRPLNLFTGTMVRARLMRNFLPPTLVLIIFIGLIDSVFFNFYNDHVLISGITTFVSLFGLTFIVQKLSENIGNDIDEIFSYRKKSEETLRESELHFRTLADSGQALIWTSGIDKECNYFNNVWLEFTGRTLEQEMGNGWLDGVHPDDMNSCLKTYCEAFDRQEQFSMDYRLRNKNGDYRWIQDNGTPRYNTKGEFIGYIGHCLDITDKKNDQEKIRKSEERYRLISSVATDYTFSTNILPDGTHRVDWISGAFESISGYSVDEFKQLGGWRSTVYPDDYEIDDNDMSKLLQNCDVESEIRTINKEGEIIWVQVFAHPVWDYANNQLAGIYGAVKNISDRKKTEEKLVQSEQRFRELLEKVNLIAIILDKNGKVTFCNNHLLRLTGYRKEEIIDKDWFDLMIPIDNPEVKKEFLNGLENGEVVSRFENPIVTKSGEKREIIWSNVLQRAPDGKFSGVASIGEDITDRNIAEKEIQKLNEELERKVIERTNELELRSKQLLDNQNILLKVVEDLNLKSVELQQSTELLAAANKELEAFSYSVSHDLRAPLRAISGFVSILMEDYEKVLDEEGKRVCNVIYENAIRMGQLIDDLLSFSRLMRSELKQAKIDMYFMVKSIISDFEQTQDMSGKTIIIDEIPTISGDNNLIKQVWINLLSNAIKYSSKKDNPIIKIGSYKDQNTQVYYIEDNGVGFNMEYSHKLFGVFQRLHSVNEFEGTGVGLAIVQRIITRHHGHVWAEGKIGEGARFYFALPII